MRDWQPVLGMPLWVWLFVVPTLFCLLALFKPNLVKQHFQPLWSVLDRLYRAGGAVAACFMVMILLIIVAQMVARWSSLTFSGSTEFAGYSMAATSFLAFAYALTRGSHIRVSVLLNLNGWLRIWLDVFAMYIAALIATYFARYAIKANQFSVMLHDVTQGQDQVPNWVLSIFSMLGSWPTQWGQIWSSTEVGSVYTPIWLPQLAMSLGAILLAVAVWDYLIRLLAHRESQIVGEVLE
ncbi:MAG TPA: C4-dicarboxylate ABC transporter permease [Oceanospirillaceae bacterium]|nr:C4-dicarboxylate ABC transporter permease [Oceanospirillaceae bacterium]